MALQTNNLVMLGLGIQGDRPPNSVQPPLVDGIHLRWAFKPELGFPWYGFHLFRRSHRDGELQCDSQEKALLGNPEVPLPEPAYRVELGILLEEAGTVIVEALLDGTPVVQTQISGSAGIENTVVLGSDAITAVRFVLSQPATLIRLCYVPVSQGADGGWERVPGFPEPLALPVSHPKYPCTPGRKEQFAPDATRARKRVRYGDPGCALSPLAHTGTVSVTNGSPVVVGIGTAWTPDMVGATMQIGGIAAPTRSWRCWDRTN
jgi:hypothetical protein